MTAEQKRTLADMRGELSTTIDDPMDDIFFAMGGGDGGPEAPEEIARSDALSPVLVPPP